MGQAWEAAAADGLSPTLFLLGQLSREDPGDSFGFLFRELGRGPGLIGPAVRDAPRHSCASALRREGTKPLEPSSAPRPVVEHARSWIHRKKPQPLVPSALLLTAASRRGFSLVPRTERQQFGNTRFPPPPPAPRLFPQFGKNPVCSNSLRIKPRDGDRFPCSTGCRSSSGLQRAKAEGQNEKGPDRAVLLGQAASGFVNACPQPKSSPGKPKNHIHLSTGLWLSGFGGSVIILFFICTTRKTKPACNGEGEVPTQQIGDSVSVTCRKP